MQFASEKNGTKNKTKAKKKYYMDLFLIKVKTLHEILVLFFDEVKENGMKMEASFASYLF